MGIFTRRRPTVDPEASRGELLDAVRERIPDRFEPLGEVLASGSGSSDTCAVLGRELASDGASLAEAFEALRTTCLEVRGSEPTYDEVLALGCAWSDATLGYLHQLSCEDPMTGLASLAHLRSRLSEVYRGGISEGEIVGRSYALVVAEVAVTGPTGQGRPPERADMLSRALLVTKLGASTRSVFAGHETIGRLGSTRIAVLARRDSRLGKRVALLRRMLLTLAAGRAARVWIEGLPPTDEAAAALLDELARP